MSKVGNGRLRRAMNFPVMKARWFNSAIRPFGDRLKERGKKMVMAGAAMRKLLQICCGVIKSGRAFNDSQHAVT